MDQKYDLSEMPVLNSMHDERIHGIELKGKELTLHYEELYFL